MCAEVDYVYWEEETLCCVLAVPFLNNTDLPVDEAVRYCYTNGKPLDILREY